MREEATHGRQRLHADCWIDWDQQGIWRHRHFIPLPPRTFQILAYLVRHANQVVTPDALFVAGWGESRKPWDLYAQIHHLRQVMEPHPQHPRWLVTRRGGGYLLFVEHLERHA
ncbi:MAG: helix-turn-helix domain-containing protein [Firmicutes bacterium]|jgi:DNA-binding response OmpR family regulator|nr:helix-turn-helix domain-containing protein [Bacillota bacterium]